MAIPVVKPTRAELDKCVARFSQLERCETGLPDMQLPEGRRAFLNVMGFSQPKGVGEFSPFGDMAPAAVSHLKAGFGVSFIAARPGNGVSMHTHDTVETFMVINGKWKLEWELDTGTEYTILEPLDFIACPIGVQRRFECVESAPGKDEGLILGMIAGEAPAAEASPASIRRLVEAGIFTPEQAQAALGNGASAQADRVRS